MAEAACVTDDMVFAASKALADYVSKEQLAAGLLYPPLTEIRNISAHIAAAVISKAVEEGVAKSSAVTGKSMTELIQLAKNSMFDPKL